MLLQNLVPNSVESDLNFVSNYGKQDLLSLRDWMPAKNWKRCSEYSKFSQEGCSEVPKSNMSFKRRKLQQKSVTLKKEPDNDELSPNAENSGSLIKYGGNNGVQTLVEKSGQRLNRESVGYECNSVRSNTEPTSFALTKLVSEREVKVNSTNTAERPNYESGQLVGDLPIRNLCISVLRRNGLFVGNTGNSSSKNVLRNSTGSNDIQSCELCGDMDKTLNMLLCDNCEEAFHVSCCKLKKLPRDEWVCQFCLKLNGKVLLQNSFLKSHSTIWSNHFLKFELGPIGVMLKYPEPYSSRVRIGESFQAAVPEWCGQFPNRDLDCSGEPLEMDATQTNDLHGCSTDKFLKVKSVSNWLQCREILQDDSCAGGRICGKWRRAPFSEVQTEFWDCSCSVIWDPSHADCAVPQELETDEVLRQLKFLAKLRPRILAKKRS